MKQEILDALNGSSFQSSVSSFQETGETGDVGTDVCHPERSEAESKDLNALSVGVADSSPIGGAKNGAEIRAHWERLRSEAAEMPGFDLDAALRDPAFVRLTAPGVGVPVADAWYALHREESERQSAAENRALLARAAASSALRPREGGGSGGAALIASDYRSLPRREQLRVKQRIFEAAARGEKVYP